MVLSHNVCAKHALTLMCLSSLPFMPVFQMSVAEYFSTNNVQQCSTLSVGPSNVLALLTGDAQIYSLGWYKLEELKSSEGGINLANSAISMPTNTRSKINSNMSKRCIEKVQATFVPLQQVISQRSTK